MATPPSLSGPPSAKILPSCGRGAHGLTVVGGAVVAKFLPKLPFLSNNSNHHKSDSMDMDDQDIIDEYRNKQKKQKSSRRRSKPTTLDLDSSDDDFDERA
jgi:hypothetical protein